MEKKDMESVRSIQIGPSRIISGKADVECALVEPQGSETMEGENNIYGKGMWAASLRFHEGTFYRP